MAPDVISRTQTDPVPAMASMKLATPEALLLVESDEQVAMRVVDCVSGALTSLTTSIGDSLGIYAALRDIGPCAAGDLAKHLGLKERWVQEWLYQQVKRNSYYRSFVAWYGYSFNMHM